MSQIIIRGAWPHPTRLGLEIHLPAERSTLAKRRWQTAAEDGTEFGFDLENHLHDGEVIFETATAYYILAQESEPIIEIAFHDSAGGARLGWSLGNLHFPVEVLETSIRTIDDPAVRQFLERDGIPFQSISAVFHPIRAATPHAHAH